MIHVGGYHDIMNTPHGTAYILYSMLTIDFSSAISQVETIKLYKLLNTAEKLKYNHRKKSFNWCN